MAHDPNDVMSTPPSIGDGRRGDRLLVKLKRLLQAPRSRRPLPTQLDKKTGRDIGIGRGRLNWIDYRLLD